MNARHLAGYALRAKALAPGSTLPWHDHGSACLCVVFDGCMIEDDPRGRRRRQANDLVFRPTAERHRNRVTAAGARVLTIEIDDDALSTLEPLGLPASTLAVRSPRATSLARQAEAELARDDEASPLVLQGLIYELLAVGVRESAERPGKAPRWLSRLHARLTEQPRESPTLAELAAEADVSAYRMSRSFRHHYGRSIGEYLREVRLAHALRLLAETDLPLAEVALEAGYFDQSHLTNILKRETGHTPAAYRHAVRSS